MVARVHIVRHSCGYHFFLFDVGHYQNNLQELHHDTEENDLPHGYTCDRVDGY